jgi:hypothetical protein
MALARGESNSSTSVAERQTDRVDPCLPSPGRERRAQKGRDRRGAYFVSFSPAVSRAAAKRIRQEMRRSWRLPRRTDKALTDLAHIFNPVIRGWIGYFGHYRKSALHPVFRHLNLHPWVGGPCGSTSGSTGPAGGALAGPDRPAAADAVRSLVAPRGEADGWLIGAGCAERLTYGSGRAWG